MADYDYKAGKKRIKDILDNNLQVIEQNKIPNDDNFTYDNSYYGWVTAIFVDIRDSSSYFSNEDKVEVSKAIRAFTSETIEILRNDDYLREIGIRGDCVYGVFTTPTQNKIYEIAEKAFYINTYMKMLNKLLGEKGFNTLEVGIGVATAQELVIKAGRKGTGINNKVWIGDAVTKASNLSSIGNKNGKQPLCFSHCSYINFIDLMVDNNSSLTEEEVKSWFDEYSTFDLGTYYNGNVIKTIFNNWINEGMPD